MRDLDEMLRLAEQFGCVLTVVQWDRALKRRLESLCVAYASGRVAEVLILVPARTDTKWWEVLSDAYPLVCFIRGRLRFGGRTSGAPFPSAIAYLGSRRKRFHETFSGVGRIRVREEEVASNA